MTEPEPYRLEHIKEALVHDSRVGELDLQIVARGGRIHVTGHVSTPGRRRAIDEVLREQFADLEVVNETSVPENTAPDACETLQ